MKPALIPIAIIIIIFISSCDATQRTGESFRYAGYQDTDTLITQSLFSDKSSTISEESIQKILDGNFKLPSKLRVAIVKLEDPGVKRFYRSDEQYLKTRQSYSDLFSEVFRQSPRVSRLSIMPDLLISGKPSFTNIREAAVRMQADVVVVYSIAGDIYSRFKLFSKPDIKAFATTQLILLDVRTGLVPFSAIITKDYLSQKTKEELDQTEAVNRIQNEAVLLTIKEMGQKLKGFLEEGKAY